MRQKCNTIVFCDLNRGFTLIEVLVAVMILGICLSVILQLFSGSLHALDISMQYNKAVSLAQGKMEELLLLSHYQEKTLQGKFDENFNWTAKINRVVKDRDKEKQMPFTMYEIFIEVKWTEKNKNKSYQINTITHGSRGRL